MTAGEAAIFFALIGAIIAFLYKAIRETTNADAFRKILNRVTVTQEIHANKISRSEDDIRILKRKDDQKDEELKAIRAQLRDMPSDGAPA